MANLSKIKREKMLGFLETLKEQHSDDESLMAINQIERELSSKKYGLVWEEHEEEVDIKMRTHIPVFTEVEEKEIVGDPDSDQYNFLLEGDNLHSLKLLEKTHKGKIDVIYIDPPYNTGNRDFMYDDSYVDNLDGYKHSKWISFMNNRLRSAKKLLSSQGVLIISIGYQEVNNLMLLCDEIFNNKQIVSVTVQTSGGKPNGGFNYSHEYLVFIAPANFEPLELDAAKTEYSSPYHGMNLATFNQVQRPNQTYAIYIDSDGKIVGCGDSLAEKVNKGIYTGELEDYRFDYDEAPAGTVAVYPVTQKGEPCVWRLISEKLMENWEKGYIKVVPTPTGNTKNKYTVQYLSGGIIRKIESGEFTTSRMSADVPTLNVDNYKTSGATIPTIWTNKSYYTTNGSNQIKEMINSKEFPYPKPIDLIKDILKRVTKDDSVILDFFAGSGTTAQAVFELNNEIGGNRRIILCTNNQNNICDKVTYPRLHAMYSGYVCKNKREHLLYESKLNLNILKDSKVLLDKVEAVKSENEGKYAKIKVEMKDKYLQVIGIDEKDRVVDGLPFNLKYYSTDYIPKENEELAEHLSLHIKEMIQLQHGVRVDGRKYVMIMDDEDMDEFESHYSEYTNLKAIYIYQDVLMTSSQEKMLNNVHVFIIPDCYFDFELREAGELW